jgi:hypothetical protein
MAFYVPYGELSDEARSLDSALTSLMEELEAVNYYNQRAGAAKDEALKKIMLHNRNEEIEHAVMLFEWLRRNVREFDKEMREYINKDAPITELEASVR